MQRAGFQKQEQKFVWGPCSEWQAGCPHSCLRPRCPLSLLGPCSALPSPCASSAHGRCVDQSGYSVPATDSLSSRAGTSQGRLGPSVGLSPWVQHSVCTFQQPTGGCLHFTDKASSRIRSFNCTVLTSLQNLVRGFVCSPYSFPAEWGKKNSDCQKQNSLRDCQTEPRRFRLWSPAWGRLQPWDPSAASTFQAQKATLHSWDLSFSTSLLSPWRGHFWDRYYHVAKEQAESLQAEEDSVP